MATISEVTLGWLEANDWPLNVLADGRVISVFHGEAVEWNVVIVPMEQLGQLLVFSVSPLRCPEENLATAAELLHRINYGLHIGNFELDYRDGEVRCRTSLDRSGATLEASMVASLVNTNVMLMNRYLPGLGLVFQGGSVDDALALFEG